MNASINKKGIFAMVAAMLMLAVAVAPLASEQGDAANATATVNIQPGQTWTWTPTFTSGLTPTVTISASSSSMPSDSASYSTSSGYASISNGKVSVSIPSSYSSSNYYVKVKAQTTQPTQTVYYEITFKVASYSLSYSADSVTAKVGTKITDITPTINGGVTAKSYAISGTLPSGLSFSTSTGKITGTPTAYKAQTSYTITATLNTTPVQTVTKTISIGAFSDIVASNYTVYAIVGETSISVPGVTMPTGTQLSGMTLSATKDGSSASVSTGTAYNGMTVAASTGAVSGKPTTAGTYVFTENYTATAATGGSSDSRTVTVVAESPVSISGSSSFTSYKGHEDSITLTKSGPSSVTWSITSIKKNGTTISSGTDYNSITLSNGVLKSSTATTAGTYTITVKAASSSTATTSSGATGTTPSSNNDTKTITLTVSDGIQITTDTPTFYTATNKVFDSLTLRSNVDGAIFSISSYGTGVTSSHIKISSAGAVTPGTSALTAGDYTVTVKVQDPNNSANSATTTLNIKVVAVLDFANAPSVGIIGE